MARRRPTSADVAREAGVSRTTVSFVLNEREDVAISEATRRRVVEAAERLGYQPHAAARQLARGLTLTIGLVLRQSAEQIAADAVLPATVQGLTSAARRAGYQVMVEALPPDSGDYAQLLRSRRVDGLVVSGPRQDEADLVALQREGFPIVLQGSLAGLDVPSVDVDNRAGARDAVAYLLGLGHRRIACVTNAPLAYTSAAERLAGYREALEAAGIDFDESLVEAGSFDAGSGHAAMDALLRRTSFSAAFVASDVVALGALGAVRAAGGRVPRDLSVVGFDDISLAAYFDPPLTTIRVPAYDLGEAAGSALLARIAGEPVPARTLLGTELLVRGSAASVGRTGSRNGNDSVPPTRLHVGSGAAGAS
ncbi:MAG TPA: LacI family DNA-binding transcriptional regulator [Candidatus Limnocylindrales bacterium]